MKNNCLDFDDLIIKTIDILNSSIEIRKKWKRLIKYILSIPINIQFEL